MSPRKTTKRRRAKSLAPADDLLLRLEATLDVDLGLAESLRRLLGELAEAFAAEQAVLVFRDPELERLFYWRVRRGQSERIAPQSAPLTRGDSFLVDDLSADLAWTSLEGGGTGFGWERSTGRRLAALPRLPEAARREFGLRSLLATVYEFGGQPAGRVLLINGERRFRQEDLRRLAGLFGRLSRQLENLFRLRNLRARAIESERRRISLDLHDGVLQILLSTEIQLDVVRRKLASADPSAAAELGGLLETLRRGREELRRIVTDLRPLGVASADLEDLMRGFADRFRQESGLALDLILDGAQLTLPDRVCRELFQIYREALHNIQKHSRATHVVVKLWQDETRAYLVVDDNGEGFNFAGNFSSEELDRLRLGPISIKERTRGIGGVLTVESTPGHGARLTVELPLS
jgi:signal transduction histidine kinase